jgi:hypothetical protein
MKTTRDYIETAKATLDLTSDYQMAKWLDLSPAALSQYKTGKRTIDDYTATKLAEALRIDAMEIIAAANFEREPEGKRKSFWEKYRVLTKAACLAILAFFSVTYDMPAQGAR